MIKAPDGTPISKQWASRFEEILLAAADNGGEFASDEDAELYIAIEDLSRVEKQMCERTCVIPLSKGMFAVVDQSDFDYLDQWNWHAKHNPSNGMFYAIREGKMVNYKHGKAIWMHREILGLQDGDEQIGDHINPLLTLDNRRTNLRIVDAQQSACNRRKNRKNTTGFKGVTYEKLRGKYRADIRVHGKRTTLGRFDTPEEAYAAYCAASARLHGEYGRTE